jgi:tetratricopeptide (TPR) repeat protein
MLRSVGLRVITAMIIFYNLLFSQTSCAFVKDDLKSLKNAVKKHPHSAECLVKLANYHIKNSRVIEGFELLVKANQLDKEYIQKSKVNKIMKLAKRVTTLKDEAILHKDKNRWNQIANIFFQIGIYDESAYAYKRSLSLDENQSEVRISLAISYLSNNNNYLAANELIEAAKRDKDNYIIRYYLTKLMIEDIYDCTMAFKYYEEAKKLIKRYGLEEIKLMQKELDKKIKMCDKR